MTEDFYERCSIKNLSPEGPSDLTSIEEQLLFSKVIAAIRKRGWKVEWLEIDYEKKSFNINHPSITKHQVIAFYEEIFLGIGKEVLEL